MAWSGDPVVDVPPSGLELLRFTASLPGHVVAQISQPRDFAIPPQPAQRWYQTDPAEPSDASHGTVILVLGGPLGNVTGEVLLDVTMDWVIQAQLPTLTSQVTPERQAIHATSGYPYYVSWLEHVGPYQLCHGRRGGIPATNPAIFRSARELVVYVLDPSAVLHLRVKTESGWQNARVTHGVVKRVWDTAANYDPCMFVFPGLNEALRFANSGGDLSAAMPCDPVDIGEGTDYCSVSNPEWTMHASLAAGPSGFRRFALATPL